MIRSPAAPSVTYSVGARLAGGGIGDTAYHAASSIYRLGHLRRLIVSSYLPTELDCRLIRSLGFWGRVLKKLGSLDRSGATDAIGDVLFDLYASRHIVPSDVFHGWANHSLRSLQKAKALGTVTVLERASSYILTQERLLREEYRMNHLKYQPIPRLVIKRALQEYRAADYVSVPSQFAYDSFVERGFDPAKLILNPYGVDAARFRPGDRDDSFFRVLFVGQVGIRKGIQYLLRAWQELGLERAELVVLGGIRPEAKVLVERVQGIVNPRSPVKFLGFSPDPLALFQSASVFAFPSIEEGSALVTYEAMACGLPVIVTANAGSVARDGVEGFVVPARDVEAIKNALLTLYRDAALRAEMGRAARNRAEQFTWQASGDKLVEVYERITR